MRSLLPGGRASIATAMSSLVSSVSSRIEASPSAVVAALARLDAFSAVRQALVALGVARFVSTHQVALPAFSNTDSTAFAVSWPMPAGGVASVTWTASVRWTSGSEAMLFVNVQAMADEVCDEAVLVAAWPLIGPLIESQTDRLLRAVVELTEEEETV